MSPITGRLAEVFRSVQGEGLLMGRRQVFVRLAGCRVGCRYCDTEWAFAAIADVAVPNRRGERVDNPLTVDDVLALVEASDPADSPGPRASVSITGGEPLEQAEFVAALARALAPRDVMLETAALDADALRLVAPHCRRLSCDVKLPSSTGLPDVLDRHEAVFASGVLSLSEPYFKLVVDGDTTDAEVERAAALIARHHPAAPTFLQPVTPLGGSPAVGTERLERLLDVLLAADLDVRVVPQVHKMLKVR